MILEPIYSVLPTVGFSSILLKHKNYLVKIYDLGGSQQIRGIWHRYFSDVSLKSNIKLKKYSSSFKYIF